LQSWADGEPPSLQLSESQVERQLGNADRSLRQEQERLVGQRGRLGIENKADDAPAGLELEALIVQHTLAFGD